MPAIGFALSGQPSKLAQFRRLPVREDTLYTDYKHRENSGIRKRAEKTLEKLEGGLGKVLEPDEAILHIAPVKAPASWLEQWTMGWYIYRVTKSVFVFTNRRILHFLLRSNGEWRRMVRSVSYGDIQEARVKGWLSPTLHLRYRDGRKETYWGLERRDSKKIQQMLAELLPAGASEATARAAIVSLCPECRTALTPGTYACGNCGLQFKDEKTMTWRSLVIPGGGYFYTGYWFLGVCDFFVEAVLLLAVLFGALELAGVSPPPPDEQPITAVGLAFIAGLLVVEKLLTVHHCRRFVRGFIPIER